MCSYQDRDGVGVGIRKPYLRVVGIQVDTEGPGRSSGAPLNPLEEEEFNRFASRPDAFETIAKSIAPSIYGSEDVKKAIACLLFGGSRKRCSNDCLVSTEYFVVFLSFGLIVLSLECFI